MSDRVPQTLAQLHRGAFVHEAKVFAAGMVAMLMLVLLVGSGFWWRHARRDALERDAAEARADSTRRVDARLLSGEIAAWERRAVQERLRADRLDRELGRTTVALSQARLTIDSLRVKTPSSKPVEVLEGDTRVGTFQLRQAPYSIRAVATLPPPPAYGEIDLLIRLDPIPLMARLMCGARDPRTGVAPATVLVAAPPWAQVQLEQVQQDPAVCSPEPTRLPRIGLGSAWRWVERAGFLAAGVYIGSR